MTRKGEPHHTIFSHDKPILALSIAIGLFTLIPYIWISQFAHPSADDFSYAVTALKLGILESQIDWYVNWSGRYTATALISFGPVYVKSLFFYKLMPIIWIFILVGMSFWFAKTLWPECSQTKRYLLVLVLLIVYFSFMPQPTEGIYWYAGAATYQAANILTLLFYGLIISCQQLSPQRKNLIVPVTAVAFFLLMGLNETSMLMHLFGLLCMTGLSALDHKEWDRGLLAILVVGLIGALIVYMAPGNSVRGSHFMTSRQPLAFVEAAVFTLYFIFSWLFFSPVWILMVLYVTSPLYNPLPAHRKRPVWMGWVLYLTMLYLGIFVGCWSLGFRPPPRTQNVIYFVFLWGLLINLHYTTPFIQSLRKRVTIPNQVRYLLAFGIVVYFFSPLCHIPRVYHQLLQGKLATFSKKMDSRYDQLVTSKDSVIRVSSIPEAKENFIFYNDIEQDTSHWSNKAYAWYFGKKAISRD